jgi:hypothetical protein
MLASDTGTGIEVRFRPGNSDTLRENAASAFALKPPSASNLTPFSVHSRNPHGIPN